jgi:hypothetical protein
MLPFFKKTFTHSLIKLCDLKIRPLVRPLEILHKLLQQVD